MAHVGDQLVVRQRAVWTPSAFVRYVLVLANKSKSVLVDVLV